MLPKLGRWITLFAAAVCCASPVLLLSMPASAQGFPSEPIKIIVSYPVGGIVDLMARVVSEKLSQKLGVPVYVDARPGANTAIGTEAVARAKPDGYTLLLATPELVVTPFMQKANWNPITDFVGVAYLGRSDSVAAVHPSVPATNIKSLIAIAKSKPGELHFLAPGTTSMFTLGAALLQIANDIKMTAVFYKGVPPGMTDLISGRIQFGFIPAPIAKDLVAQGKLNAIAVTGAARLTSLPQIPTMIEQGYETSEVTVWFIFVAPSKTPKPVVDRLNAALNDVLKDPAVIARIDEMGGRVASGWTSEQINKLISEEYPRWGEVIRKSGIKPEQ